jgi:SAM-dependent methyltransferase
MTRLGSGAPASTDRAEHWDAVYRRLDPHAVSWYQVEPVMSLRLLELAGSTTADAVVDVGGGTGLLASTLVVERYGDVTVLDVSAEALALAKQRCPCGVTFIRGSVLEWVPARRFDVWHDRAVFHFLGDPADRRRYRGTLLQALPPGGLAVMGVFAADGPPTCSGLPVERYDRDALATALGDGFETIACEHEVHRTPGGAEQPFTWLAARRVR